MIAIKPPWPNGKNYFQNREDDKKLKIEHHIYNQCHIHKKKQKRDIIRRKLPPQLLLLLPTAILGARNFQPAATVIKKENDSIIDIPPNIIQNRKKKQTAQIHPRNKNLAKQRTTPRSWSIQGHPNSRRLPWIEDEWLEQREWCMNLSMATRGRDRRRWLVLVRSVYPASKKTGSCTRPDGLTCCPGEAPRKGWVASCARPILFKWRYCARVRRWPLSACLRLRPTSSGRSRLTFVVVRSVWLPLATKFA